MRIALLFWGLTRSLKFTLNSIQKTFFDEFKKHNIEYKIFLHTYFFNDIHNKYNFDEYKLLNPDYFIIDNQDEIKQKINIQQYYALKFNYSSRLIHNLICGLYSQLQVTNLLFNSGEHFDYVFFIRPDVLFGGLPFQIRWLHWVNENRFILPTFGSFDGINDRFAVLKMSSAFNYGTRFNRIFEYNNYVIQNNKKISSENFLHWIMSNFKKKTINILFKRIRENGDVRKIDNKLF